MSIMDAQKIWSSLLVSLKEQIPQSSFEPWILPLVPSSYEDGKFSVLTGQSFAITMIKRYNDVIEKALKDEIGSDVEFEIVFDEKLAVKHNKKLQKLKSTQDLTTKDTSTKYDNLKKMQSAPKLNLKYKFENFVVGENNKFAYLASMATAKEPGEKHNPLFIYGGSGLGKTHLMQAIGHYIVYNRPELKVKFVQTEEFINDLINSLIGGMDKTSKMSTFRQKYRNVDVLLIDDIQFIEGKGRTVIEVFNTFEALYNAGKQIVLTSDREPKYIQDLPDRLRSRFEWGLMVDVQIPDLETRMAILTKLAKSDGIKLPLDVIEFMANVYSKNVRELEGAYNRVTAYMGACGIKPDIETAKQILKISDAQKQIGLDEILNAVADYYKVSAKELKGQSRSQKLSNARQVAIYLSRELTDMSYNEIGDFYGRKHTTVMYSCDKVKEEAQINKVLAGCISELCGKIKQ